MYLGAELKTSFAFFANSLIELSELSHGFGATPACSENPELLATSSLVTVWSSSVMDLNTIAFFLSFPSGKSVSHGCSLKFGESVFIRNRYLKATIIVIAEDDFLLFQEKYPKMRPTRKP